MDIVSYKFALILVFSVFIFYLLNSKLKVPYLIVLSCSFIASYDYSLLIYVIIYAFLNYSFGLLINGSGLKRMYFRIGIVINIMQLILLKYHSFALNPILDLLKMNPQFLDLSRIIIPLGVSFFSLQGIGYLINIKMGWEKPERNFANFLMYIIFFPKFISGPIERSNHFLPQVRSNILFNQGYVSTGMRILLIGFFKKVAIANQLAPYTLLSHQNPDSIGGYVSWAIFVIQPLYLYFDFSGYTDIAIGAAKMFGFNLLPNFQRPFFAENVSTFWRRFHMSLSSWFNDYIFRQASFKHRKWGIYASIYAVVITWILFGIWHGAGWNFMILGVIQSLAIIYEFLTKNLRTKLFNKFPLLIARWSGRFFVYLFYSFSLVFFFSPNIRSAFSFIKNLHSFDGPSPFNDLSLKPFQVMVYVPIFLFFELLKNDYSELYSKISLYGSKNYRYRTMIRWAIYTLMITIIYITGFKSQQFVYANF